MPTRGRLFGLLGVSAVVVVLALSLGLGLGLGLNHGDKKSTSAAAKDATPTVAAAASTGKNTNTATALTPLAKFDWKSEKMLGMALGNWLVLERWMDEDWFTGLAGANSWDEYDFSVALGANASAALTEHWTTYITEDDVKSIATAGFNHLRVPIGFWALIPTEGSEPYVQTGQLAQLDRIAGYAYNNNMHVLLDLHGMPGNQNGEQQSGKNLSTAAGEYPKFFDADQQVRSDATVQAAIDYMGNSSYSSVFSGLGIVNEPRPYTADQLNTLEGFYERSYATLSALGHPTIIHHAFQGLDYWRPFLAGKDPSLVIMEDHPYPGNFPLQTNAADIIKQVCDKAASYAKFPVPVAVTEWSLTTGLTDADFEKRFFRAQSSAFGWSGGSTFWAYKTKASDNPVLANPATVRQYSYVDLMESGALEAPSTWASSTDTPACGAAPSITWASPVASATSTPSPVFAHRRRSPHRISKEIR